MQIVNAEPRTHGGTMFVEAVVQFTAQELGEAVRRGGQRLFDSRVEDAIGQAILEHFKVRNSHSIAVCRVYPEPYTSLLTWHVACILVQNFTDLEPGVFETKV